MIVFGNIYLLVSGHNGGLATSVQFWGSTSSEVSSLPEGSQVISDTSIILVHVQIILTLLCTESLIFPPPTKAHYTVFNDICSLLCQELIVNFANSIILRVCV